MSRRWPRFGMFGILLALTAIPPTARAAADDKDLADVRKLLERFDQAYQAKDLDALGQVISQDADVVFFMPDVGNRWVGFNAIKAGLRADFTRLKSVGIEAQPATVHLRGNLAWFERTLVLTLVVNEGDFAILTRSTGVVEKRQGQWLIVQQHMSVGAPRDSAPKD